MFIQMYNYGIEGGEESRSMWEQCICKEIAKVRCSASLVAGSNPANPF